MRDTQELCMKFLCVNAGEGGGGTCYEYLHTHTHTVYTSILHHMKTPEVYKYSKSSKMYFHYLIWMKLTKH